MLLQSRRRQRRDQRARVSGSACFHLRIGRLRMHVQRRGSGRCTIPPFAAGGLNKKEGEKDLKKESTVAHRGGGAGTVAVGPQAGWERRGRSICTSHTRPVLPRVSAGSAVAERAAELEAGGSEGDTTAACNERANSKPAKETQTPRHGQKAIAREATTRRDFVPGTKCAEYCTTYTKKKKLTNSTIQSGNDRRLTSTHRRRG